MLKIASSIFLLYQFLLGSCFLCIMSQAWHTMGLGSVLVAEVFTVTYFTLKDVYSL